MRDKLTHLSLFSGIGGLDLSAEWVGIQTIGQCEWADYSTKVLEKHWPEVPRWKDIRTLTKESFYERTGRRTVDIISGGFPCQPFSVAGKQRGKEDDRYLWPEMVRVIKELWPAWVVGENVAGIVRMELPDILSELEACGYRTRTFLIPACAVGSRHRRYRVAIVGHAEHNGSSSAEITGSIKETGGGKQEREKKAGQLTGTGEPGNSKDVADTVSEQNRREEQQEFQTDIRTGGKNVQYTDSTGRKEQYTSRKPGQQRFSGWGCDERNVCHTTSQRLQNRTGQPLGGQGTSEQESERSDRDVSNANNRSGYVRRSRELSAIKETGSTGDNIRTGEKEHEPRERRSVESVLGRMADGIPAGMDRDFLINHYWDIEPDIPRIATGIKHSVDKLKCLGNAVVPQQFYPIFKAIAEVERTWRENRKQKWYECGHPERYGAPKKSNGKNE